MRLVAGRHPLLGLEGVSDFRPLSSGEYHRARFTLTADGGNVLAGKSDFIELNGIDLWLGGVHLAPGGKLWRWDDEGRFLLQV